MESSRKDDNDKQIKFLRGKSCLCGKSTLNSTNLLCFSFVFNIVFVVLFVLVFIQLNNVQSRLAKLESPQVSDESNKLSTKATDGGLNPFALRANSTLPPFTAITANVTTPPILLKSMPSLHISRRSTSNAHPTQPSDQPFRREKKIPKSHREYVKYYVKRELSRYRGRSLECQCDAGPQGLKGDLGPRGKKGLKGDIGLTGPQGSPGQHGSNGFQGMQGLQGSPGPKGDRGPQGDLGKGIKGETGVDGPPGKRGPQGKPGDRGLQGEIGERGPKGEKGDTGSLESIVRPSAHLAGHTSNTPNSPRSDILRHWENNLGFAHSAGGMQYENGELVIPLNGRYYVYSQLYFQVEDDRPHMIHYVHLNRTGTQQVIMRSVSSRCRAKRAQTFLYSSYQGGVFELQNGDHILVGVSDGNADSISTAGSASFFGAFLV